MEIPKERNLIILHTNYGESCFLYRVLEPHRCHFERRSVILVKLLPILKTQYPHLQNGDNRIIKT